MAILGAVGGWLTGEVFSPYIWHVGETHVRLALVASTTIVCLVLGFALRAKIDHRLWPGWVTFGVLVAGFVNSMFIAMWIGRHDLYGSCDIHIDEERWPFAAGCVAATVGVFLVAVLLVVWSMRNVGRARRRSLVERVAERTPWRTLAVLCGVAARFCGSTPLSYSFVFTSATVAVTCLLLDLSAYWKLRRTLARPLVPLPEQAQPATVDLGVGDELHAELQPSGGPFRRVDVPIFVLRGQALPALRALWRSLFVDVAAVAATVAMVLIRR